MITRKKFPEAVYLAILKRQRMTCCCDDLCGQPLTREEGIEFDHWLSLHLGGKDRPNNLRALRKPCHLKKTIAEAKARAKIRRIRRKRMWLATHGTHLNKRARTLRRLEDWRAMP